MLASHVIFGAYGFWLPNDPRGSWSDFVGAWELFRYAGRATKTTETRSLAGRPHDHSRRRATKLVLKRPSVKLTGVQARAVAHGFANYADCSGLSIFACAVLPNHVHLVLGSFRLSPEKLVIQLTGAATRELVRQQLHPFGDAARPAKCFARGEWTVYLDTEDDVRRAIRYVEENPVKEGLRRQAWSFVTPFGG
jgi:REP element-mobilizing transposase RayT